MANLSIIYPNLNGDKAELVTLLSSIRNSSYHKKNLEVIMVDNGSTNNSPDFVAQNFPWVEIIKLKKNYGFSKAVNIGIKAARGKYIFVTNDDVKLEKNCLKNIVDFMESDPAVGIVGCKVYGLKNPAKISCSAIKHNFFTGRFHLKKNVNKIQETDWVAGAGIAFPKKVWQKLGGYDEGFFFSSEETDFCLRAKYQGFKIIYLPKAVFWHGGSTTIHRPQYIDFFRKQLYRGKIRLILKHGKLLEITSTIIFQFLLAAYYSCFTRGKDLSAYFDAIIFNFKNLPLNISKLRKTTLSHYE